VIGGVLRDGATVVAEMVDRRSKKPAPRRGTIAEVRRAEEEDVVRDLEASLAHDPSSTTRAKRLAELRALPRTPTHPLALYLKERGVSREEAAEMLGLRRAEIEHVIRDWKRPRGAELIAEALGLDVEEIFPMSPNHGT
jgi:lambda repressor-like predicted transcriptional regulator